MSRIQIAQAILMYLGSAAATLSLGLVLALAAAGGLESVPRTTPPIVFALIYFMNLAPKLAGILGVLLSKEGAARYGGTARLLAGVGAEFWFYSMLSVIMAVRSTLFMVSLLFGRTVVWGSQVRDAQNVTWRSAAAVFWPETLLGAVLLAGTIAVSSGISLALIFGVALILSIPFAVFTSSRWLGYFFSSTRICGIPEEFEPCEILDRIAAAPCFKQSEVHAPAAANLMSRGQLAEKIAIP